MDNKFKIAMQIADRSGRVACSSIPMRRTDDLERIMDVINSAVSKVRGIIGYEMHVTDNAPSKELICMSTDIDMSSRRINNLTSDMLALDDVSDKVWLVRCIHIKHALMSEFEFIMNILNDYVDNTSNVD